MQRMRVISLNAPQSKMDKAETDARYARELRFRQSCFTMDIRLPKTKDELLKSVRTAIEFDRVKRPRDIHIIQLPAETSFGVVFDHLTVPRDERLESLARRLVEDPGQFVSKENSDLKVRLRLEGIKALRLFPSEKNLTLIRSWLDDAHTKGRSASNAFLPGPARTKTASAKLPTELGAVPEVHFQQPLPKTMSLEEAQLRTACTIDMIHYLNQTKTDGFMEELARKRTDLAGLPFMMGDRCRMTEDAAGNFAAGLGLLQEAEQAKAKAQAWTQGMFLKRGRDLMSFYNNKNDAGRVDASAQVASLIQVLGHEDEGTRLGLVEYLSGIAHVDATRALAKLAVFSEEADVRAEAVRALKLRRDRDYTDILLSGLRYPWPAVAERSSEAIVQLGRGDLVPHLVDLLENPDPRAPHEVEKDGKTTTVVRELVRINHHHNCLLCHAPAARELNSEKEKRTNIYQEANVHFENAYHEAKGLAKRTDKYDKEANERSVALRGLENASIIAQIPVPSESMEAYYRPSNPDILVRFDVTYLRQDFSIKLFVDNAEPWPTMQRYDFLVRTREVTAKEAGTLRELLRSQASPYQRVAHSALRQLTGHDAGPTAAAWKKVLRG